MHSTVQPQGNTGMKDGMYLVQENSINLTRKFHRKGFRGIII